MGLKSFFGSLFGREEPEELEHTPPPPEESEEEKARKAAEAAFPALAVGMQLDLLDEENIVLFSARLTSFSLGELVLERIPGAVSFPILERGSSVRVRGYGRKMEPLNITATITEATLVLYRLSNPALLPYVNYRQSARQPLSVPAALYQLEDTRLHRPQECLVLDISTGGARITSGYCYCEGDVYRLWVELVKGGGHMAFPSKIVRVKALKNGRFEYGLLFAQLTQRQIGDLDRDIKLVQGQQALRLKS